MVIVRDGSAGVERVGLALLAGCTCLTTSFLSISLLVFFFGSHTKHLTTLNRRRIQQLRRRPVIKSKPLTILRWIYTLALAHCDDLVSARDPLTGRQLLFLASACLERAQY